MRTMRGLMGHALGDRSTPRALALARQAIEFKGRLEYFQRLTEITERDLATLDADQRPADWRNSPVSAELEFAFADVRDALPAVAGTVSARLPAVCQRCLEVCTLELSQDLHYLLLPAEQSGAGPEGYEVWELDDATIRPADLVEESLVMALPVAAAHERPEDCGPLAGAVTNESADDGESSRPFAGLRQLMNERKR